jgi:4-hydroxy-4-methyl-2-oxoglutarate aldolase
MSAYSADELATARRLGAATLHEAAGKIGALPSAIRPVDAAFRLAGPAATVHGPAADNLWLHRAIYAAQPGEVLVAYVSGHFESGYWGGVMTQAALARGLAGLVIDGCVRDGAELPGLGFPVFSRGLCIRGTGKDANARGAINAPLLIGDATIAPGDMIVGDADGVVAIPATRFRDALATGIERERKEAQIVQRINRGETTLDIYGLK